MTNPLDALVAKKSAEAGNPKDYFDAKPVEDEVEEFESLEEAMETDEVVEIVATVSANNKAPGRMLIHMDDTLKALAIAVVAEKNVMLTGFGGHAKSEILQQVKEFWNGDHQIWIQSLNANTNVPDMLGGYSKEAIQDFRFDRPRVEESWVGKAKIAIFEEAFDAPPRVLTSIKDILTAKEWRHGEEAVPLETRVVVIVSNHDPEDVRRINPSVDALVQRFPLHVNVMWNTYTEEDFATMLEVLAGRKDTPDEFIMPNWDTLVNTVPVPWTEENSDMLSCLLAGAVADGCKISPRTAVYCRDILTAWAAIQGHKKIEHDDFTILRLVADIGVRFDKAWEKAQYYMRTANDRNFMRNIKGRITRLTNKAEPILEAHGKGNLTEKQRADALDIAKKVATIKADMGTREWQDTNYDGYKETDQELDEFGENILDASGIKTSSGD